MSRSESEAPSSTRAPPAAAPSAERVLDRWLEEEIEDVGNHQKRLLRERDGRRPEVIPLLREIARRHYVGVTTQAGRLAALGARKTAALLTEELPRTERARSGELGEILATEFVDGKLEFEVPIRRLRWKDGREMAIRGDDLLGVATERDGKKLRLLKGEAKSRRRMTQAVTAAAAEALNRDRDRPSRHSVLFVAKRLRDKGEDELATALEEVVLDGFRGVAVEHLLFSFSGNSAAGLLGEYLKNHRKRRTRRHAVGLQVEDHQEFIRDLFESM